MSKKATVYELESGALPDIRTASILILDFSASETMRNKCFVWTRLSIFLLQQPKLTKTTAKHTTQACGFSWVHHHIQLCFIHQLYRFSVLSLWPLGLQHTRFPCPSLPPWACWNSCPLSWWCHPTISSSVTRFSSCPQTFQASKSFSMSQIFTSGHNLATKQQQ